ncbi:hypothetical protein FQR65_LT14524 [Abscondita terminalis]|nr:hypothetical protein FQR65_LT14524 [Abscondita terminalis]
MRHKTATRMYPALFSHLFFVGMPDSQKFCGSSRMRVLTRNELFGIIERSNSSTFNEKLKFMVQKLLNQYAENDQNIGDVKHKLSIVRHQFKQKWSAARNTKARFLENNTEWLKGCISLPKADARHVGGAHIAPAWSACTSEHAFDCSSRGACITEINLQSIFFLQRPSPPPRVPPPTPPPPTPSSDDDDGGYDIIFIYKM